MTKLSACLNEAANCQFCAVPISNRKWPLALTSKTDHDGPIAPATTIVVAISMAKAAISTNLIGTTACGPQGGR
jgi:hypothetical protein